MKQFPRIFAVAIIAALLGGCAPQLANVENFISTAATTIVNPLRPVDMYRVKNVYAASLQLAVDYRAACWSKPYAVILTDPVMKPVCQNRRAVVRTIQSAKLKAKTAIRAADDFMLNNPTVNAGTFVTAAWAAVSSFQSAIPSVK